MLIYVIQIIQIFVQLNLALLLVIILCVRAVMIGIFMFGKCQQIGAVFFLKIFFEKNFFLDKNEENENTSNAFTVLRGHRSIVNHVKYGSKSGLMLSCGVEKIVKVNF